MSPPFPPHSICNTSKATHITEANFKGFAAELLYEKKITGFTCHERLIKDRGEGVPMGKKYYEHLRDLYQSEESPTKKIKISNEKESLMPLVEKALLAMLGKDKDYSVMLDFFEHGPKVINQKTMAVLMRQMTKVPPLHPQKNTDLHIAGMAYIARHALRTLYADEFTALRGIFDTVLGKTFSSYKASDLSAKLWWQGHSHIGSLLIPKQAMDELCAVKVKGTWASVEAQLRTVVRSCETGERVFGFALKKLQMARTTELVEKKFEELFAKDVTQDRLVANRSSFVAELKKKHIDAHAAMTPYTVSTTYRGVQLELTVRSAIEEYLTCQACQLHGLGVDLGMLPEIACEGQLVPENRERPTIKVEAAILGANKRARETAIDLLRGLEEQSGIGVLSMFRKKHSIMYGLDKKWSIEFAFIESHVGEKGVTRLRSKILASLPTTEAPITLKESYARFEVMSKSTLLSFCGAGMEHVFENIFEWVRSIRAGRPPQFQGECSEFISNAKGRLANLLVAEPAGDAKPLYGRDAVSHVFSEVKALVETSSKQMCMKKLAPLHVFGWLLTAEEEKLVAQWTDAEFDKGASKDEVPSAAKSKAGSRKRSGQDALAKLEALMKD